MRVAHAVDEDLGAAAGQRVEPGRDQALQHRLERQRFSSRHRYRISSGESACSLIG